MTTRGLEGQAILRDDADRGRWLDLLDRVATRRQWRLHAFALMDNHFHLSVRTPGVDLSAGMHALNDLAAHSGVVGPSALANTVRRTCAEPGPARRLGELRRLRGGDKE